MRHLKPEKSKCLDMWRFSFTLVIFFPNNDPSFNVPYLSIMRILRSWDVLATVSWITRIPYFFCEPLRDAQRRRSLFGCEQWDTVSAQRGRRGTRRDPASPTLYNDTEWINPTRVTQRWRNSAWDNRYSFFVSRAHNGRVSQENAEHREHYAGPSGLARRE